MVILGFDRKRFQFAFLCFVGLCSSLIMVLRVFFVELKLVDP